MAKVGRKAYMRNYHKEYRKKNKAQLDDWARKFRWSMKVQCLTHYSNGDKPHCALCGESDAKVLCIDHINGGGRKHFEELNKHGGWQFYMWLKKQNYPSEYQVLCYNCNIRKRYSEYNLYAGEEGS